MVDGSGSSEPSDGSEISLEDLSRAFANALHVPHTPSFPSMEPGTGEELPVGDAGVPVTPSAILEAVLFVGAPDSAGVPTESLLGILKGLSREELDKEVAALNLSYEQSNHPWRIVTDGSGYALQLIASMESVLDRLHTAPRDHTLSQTAIDCLSLVAYQSGISKHQLETQWGQNAGATLHYLVRKGLVRVEKNGEGGEDRYFTTERFLEILGIGSLDDLPQGEEL